MNGKPVVGVDGLRVLLTFNFAFDSRILPCEGQRAQLDGCYKILAYTGVRPAELVDNERPIPKDNAMAELFGKKVVEDNVGTDGNIDGAIPTDSGYCSDDGGNGDVGTDLNEHCKMLNEHLAQEHSRSGRPKALCYEDIQLMVVRHPMTSRGITAMAIKFIHHKGADNKPRPYVALLLAIVPAMPR
jgi:hypothetical protein